VVADQKGPGVVTRIWTPHPNYLIPKGREWGDIQIEVDDQIIYSGPANGFFLKETLPFKEPLVVLRDETGPVPIEKVNGERKWITSYMPIPFDKRFRYMQRDSLYANINIKALPPKTKVESFLDVNWDELEEEVEKTAFVWESMDLYGVDLNKYRCIKKVISVSPSVTGSEKTLNLEELTGPGIIRTIRFKAKEARLYRDVDLLINWDDEMEPGIRSPLDHGFGSRTHRTMAIGQSEDGWRFCSLPMPFRKKARLTLASRVTQTVDFQVELYMEENAKLPKDVLYLHSCKNQGQFLKNQDQYEKPDLPLKDFYYHNGYTALDLQGSGHVVAYMDMFHCQPELDEHIFIDDERTFPDNSWNGTGHEDLFDMSGGHKSITSPMTSGGSEDFKETNVKLFWNNPMTFRKAIRWNWEWIFKFGIKAPRDARFASVVYWYSKP